MPLPFGKLIALMAQSNDFPFPYPLPCSFVVPSHSAPGLGYVTFFREGLNMHCMPILSFFLFFFFRNHVIGLKRSPHGREPNCPSQDQPYPASPQSLFQLTTNIWTSPKTRFAKSGPLQLFWWPGDSSEIINGCCFQQLSFGIVFVHTS